MPGCYHQSGFANGSPERRAAAAPTFPDTPDYSPIHPDAHPCSVYEIARSIGPRTHGFPDAGTLAESVRGRHPAAQTRIC